MVQAGLYGLINIDQIPGLSSLPKEEVDGFSLEAVNNAIDILEQRTAFLDEGKIGLATNSHGRTNDGDIAIRELQQGRLQILQSLYELRKNLTSLYLGQTDKDPPSSSE